MLYLLRCGHVISTNRRPHTLSRKYERNDSVMPLHLSTFFLFLSFFLQRDRLVSGRASDCKKTTKKCQNQRGMSRNTRRLIYSGDPIEEWEKNENKEKKRDITPHLHPSFFTPWAMKKKINKMNPMLDLTTFRMSFTFLTYPLADCGYFCLGDRCCCSSGRPIMAVWRGRPGGITLCWESWQGHRKLRGKLTFISQRGVSILFTKTIESLQDFLFIDWLNCWVDSFKSLISFIVYDLLYM